MFQEHVILCLKSKKMEFLEKKLFKFQQPVLRDSVIYPELLVAKKSKLAPDWQTVQKKFSKMALISQK